MSRLRVLSGREICTIPERRGFVRVRQRGSHIVMQRAAEGSTTTVPVPDHNEVRIGTLRSIIRQSGLPRFPFGSRHLFLSDIFFLSLSGAPTST